MENKLNNIPNLDDKMNMLNDTRQQLKTLQAQEKTLKDTQNYLEAEIAADMAKQGLTQTGNDVCTISLKTETVPTVEDWDVLHQHISDTGRFELLQKRMSATAYRELIAMEPSVPGVRSTELTKVNFRSK
ncbi:MAG: hypothetical protein CMI74_07365 [Candidatus Pelagibacter sp.]|jgi:hypothetical protein|nr:hypothetical protein [Candidatus Pelagibacter sp.]|tara:strand:- start:161 stop:550 length:390 start_codon:yes stop_codon:yes gene_type:complete